MNAIEDFLPVLLRVCAVLQIAVAFLNFMLVRLMNWRPQLERMEPLVREVFMVHLLFISAILLIFGVLTWQFAFDMADGTNDVATWLCAAIAIFWGVRVVLQVTYYSSRHWRGKVPQTIAHVVLLVMYGGMTVIYGAAAW